MFNSTTARGEFFAKHAVTVHVESSFYVYHIPWSADGWFWSHVAMSWLVLAQSINTAKHQSGYGDHHTPCESRPRYGSVWHTLVMAYIFVNRNYRIILGMKNKGGQVTILPFIKTFLSMFSMHRKCVFIQVWRSCSKYCSLAANSFWNPNCVNVQRNPFFLYIFYQMA